MRISSCFFVPVAMLCASAAAAAGPWTLHDAVGASHKLKLSGSFRTRYETLTGQFRPGLDDDDDILLFRTTLFAEYDFGPIRIGGELYDSRAYDVDPGSPVSNNEVNALEPAQLYIGVDLGEALGAGSATAVDAGRFTMELASGRLVTKENFRNTTNGFTGARLSWTGKGKQNVTLFATMPQIRRPEDKASILDNEVEWDDESSDYIFYGGVATLPKLVGPASFDVYFMALEEDDPGGRATRNRHLYTPGARLLLAPHPGGWDYEFEAAYQFGHIRASTAADAVRQDVSAGFVHAEVGRTFGGDFSPRLSAELDYASGDGSGGKYGRFDTLFGSRTSDFGPTSTYGPLGRANIISPRLTLETARGPWDSLLSYRAAWLASRSDSFASTGVRDPAGQSGHFAAHQVEVRVRRWLVKDLLRAELGGAALIDGEFLERAPNATGHGDTLYGYSALQLTF